MPGVLLTISYWMICLGIGLLHGRKLADYWNGKISFTHYLPFLALFITPTIIVPLSVIILRW